MKHPRLWIPDDCFDDDGNPFQTGVIVRPKGKVPLYPAGWHLMMPEAEHFALLEAARQEARAEAVKSFAKSILHGDETHRAWLINEADKWVSSPASQSLGSPERVEE